MLLARAPFTRIEKSYERNIFQDEMLLLNFFLLLKIAKKMGEIVRWNERKMHAAVIADSTIEWTQDPHDSEQIMLQIHQPNSVEASSVRLG